MTSDKASLKMFVLISDRNDFGESTSPRSVNCNRGGGFRGLILPPSKSSSAKSEVCSNCPRRERDKEPSLWGGEATQM
ncbi:hypothetical protein U1Q18_003629 [Sarracenia purpurea var. burkii]